MALLKPTENPTIADTILFELPTPDANGCFLANPYKVDSVVIYYVERDFTSGNFREYKQKTYQADKLKAAEEAEALACTNPTTENIDRAKRLRAEAESDSASSPFFFNEARPVRVIGTPLFPAWLSTDTENALIEKIDTDEDGNTVYGQFKYEWEPDGMREGDYFICWTWTPLPAGDSLSSHLTFSIGGSPQLTTSIPTHYTVPEKYETLLERYTPEMFKLVMCDDDRSPDVLDKFNKSIADGFTVLENLANQIVDLQDSNSTHELLLPYLSNLFDLKLKTGDPTLWRRQIKRAVPLFKMKGTKKALEEALDQAGIRLNKITRLWQIISSYTWQEAFTYTGETEEFELTKVAHPVDPDNFELWLRPAGEDEYIPLSSDYVSFDTSEGVTTMSWVGHTLSVDPIDLVDGDILRVLYQYAEIPGPTEQTIENYIRSLPLADQRDERKQDYPLKNWNVRVIAEDDPLFDVVIPNRHPYTEPLIFGKVRTEFPYSENVYNMEEYNGSIRNSKEPCDIDKDFLDPCTACLSSKYNIDLEIDDLSNDRLLEAQDVLREFVPFHAVLHTLNFVGGVNEFVQSPVEDIEILVMYQGEDFVIAGEGQMWFNRAMKRGTTTAAVYRNALAQSEVAVATTTGTAYNDEITIFCPDIRFDRIGMATDGTAILEILAPSANAGTTTLSSPQGNIAVVASATEPLNTSSFTFRVSNPVLDGTLCNVHQDNYFTFSDSEANFGQLGVKSVWDVDNNAAAGAWKVLIPAYSATAYTILNVLPDGSLVLEDQGDTLPSTNAVDVTYTLRDNNDQDILDSDSGKLVVRKRGRTEVLDSNVEDVRESTKVGFYQEISGSQYQITGYVDGQTDEFYIDGYDGGDVAGVNLVVYQRIADNEIGYLSHRGLKLRAAGNLESSLSIPNGRNSLIPEDDIPENDRFKENFLVVIDDNYYFMSEVDGDNPSGFTTLTLSGPDLYWKTFGAGGTSVDFTIYRYVKQSATIPGQQFDFPEHDFRNLDRQGREIITSETETAATMSALSAGDAVSETVSQTEAVTFTIEYADGSSEEGEL